MSAETEASALCGSERLRRRAATSGERTTDDYLILDLETGDYFTVGSVGELAWKQLDGERSLDDIAGCIAREFDVTAEEAREDLFAFARQLLAQGLAERGE